MQPDVSVEIEEALSRIESEKRVTILYACESGSRAWGFESADSDYDVRFIYLRRTAAYLTIPRGRDVIELPLKGQIDLSGWDLPKALSLLYRSNPPLLEWLRSPIVYRSRSRLHERLKMLLAGYYSPAACMHHYLHMAQRNCREYLNGDEVWTKKYFYVLRPVLACLWIERELGVVPTEFQKLADGVVDDAALRAGIEELLAAKRSGEELRRGPRNELISSFVESELSRLSAAGQPRAQVGSPALLNRVLLETLNEVNGPYISVDDADWEDRL